MRTYRKAAGPYLVWAGVFVVVSLVMVGYYALTNQTGGLTLEHFSRILSVRTIGTVLRSVKIAALTTLLCLLIGYPFAYFVAQLKTRYQTTALLLVMIPMWMNFLLRTYAWVTILSKNGILNSFLAPLGVAPLDLLYTEPAVVLGMVYNFLPFMILPIYTALEKMDRGLIEAAQDLGSDSLTTFVRVVFPLSLPGVFAGVAMVFIPAISTFEITALLGGNKTNLIGNVIEQQFTVTGDWNYGSALAVMLMVFLVISLFFTSAEQREASSAFKPVKDLTEPVGTAQQEVRDV